jgi:hypothetical protein
VRSNISTLVSKCKEANLFVARKQKPDLSSQAWLVSQATMLRLNAGAASSLFRQMELQQRGKRVPMLQNLLPEQNFATPWPLGFTHLFLDASPLRSYGHEIQSHSAQNIRPRSSLAGCKVELDQEGAKKLAIIHR